MYVFYRAIEVAMVLLIVIAMFGCKPEEHADFNEQPSTIIIEDDEVKTMSPKEEILKIVNNDKPADELIKTVYAENEIKYFIKLSRVLQERHPECVRYSNDKVYLIYKYEEDNYLFLMYNSIEEDSYPLSWWYFGEKLYLEDFEKLYEEKASIGEIGRAHV